MNQEKKKGLTKFKTETMEAIKQNCFECMGGRKKTDCRIEKCYLYGLRPWAGKNSSVPNKLEKISTKK